MAAFQDLPTSESTSTRFSIFRRLSQTKKSENATANFLCYFIRTSTKMRLLKRRRLSGSWRSKRHIKSCLTPLADVPMTC